MSCVHYAFALSAPLAVLLQPAAGSKGAAAASPFAYAPFKYGACTARCNDAPPTKEHNCTQEVCAAALNADPANRKHSAADDRALSTMTGCTPSKAASAPCQHASLVLVTWTFGTCKAQHHQSWVLLQAQRGSCSSDAFLRGSAWHPAGFCQLSCGRCR